MTCDIVLPVTTKVVAGAPEAEIEIPPEIIEAGIKALREYSVDGDIGNSAAVRRDLVVSVFCEMIGALRERRYPPGKEAEGG